MDTSETYIKMCEKAEEIQGIVKPAHTISAAWKVGDYVANAKLFKVTIVSGHTGSVSSKLVWLPRQDQLQEMLIKDTLLEPVRLCNCFSDWLSKEWEVNEDANIGESYHRWKHYPYTSMEQLWLAFVMKEKYNKVWNGEDWK